MTLDFGAGAFGGDVRWLEISAKASADPDYTEARQSCSPAPYSVYATDAPRGGAVPGCRTGRT